MDAIVISKFGGPEVLEARKVPKPVPGPEEVLIHVAAFGLNHAEMHMRKGEWDEWNPITGLECVGVVESCPNGAIPAGTKVIGVMGGMGRTRPGSYGEFVAVPISNVVPIETTLPWEDLAAIPEVYSAAYSFGQAALNLAADAGAKVTATTRRQERRGMLEQMGAADVKLERAELYRQLSGGFKFDKVLNLVGNSVLLESIALVRTGGCMLQAGWLGGLAPLKEFNPMIEMEPGIHFSLFHSKVLGSAEFPMSAVPLQEIVSKIQNGGWNAKPTHVFDHHDIKKAHEVLDSHEAGGKVVIRR
ncbi:uncharacterized protein TRUGW13939_01055 [Talaromyces rugulosus]|uniref:Enoyl reductase (ER) domain-containing protein n=1 Tax=Talaromyces rugulosus TaxID=121627 RepID=A0A7H8QKE4_TALRU|nr:uncharacterized protein TRUGW13939_01055 [Talaromyces rugulosus]QKX53975.1 hypothetical protein TRUGW13939_01055 [Talaromyces rugulosus]